MRPAARLAWCGIALTAGSMAASAQTEVISARSGLIHYVEGQVTVGDKTVETKYGVFPEVKENQTLKTAAGRAEILLTPAVFLRLGENSSFRMITDRLIDTRLEFLSGSGIVEADDIGKDNSITIVFHDATVHFPKKGLFRFDAASSELRVLDGMAEVTANDETREIKQGHQISLDTLAESRFDKSDSDALNRWSERRASYVSMANVSAADSLTTSPNLFFTGGWFWNQFFGMYTFVPGMMDDLAYSPYGFPFWSPFNVYMAFMPGYYYAPYGYGGYPGGYATGYNSAGKSVPTPWRSGSGTPLYKSTGESSSGGRLPSIGSSSIPTSTISPVTHSPGAAGSNAAHH